MSAPVCTRTRMLSRTPGLTCPCPLAQPLLTLFPHAALQALAKAAGLALTPSLLGDLAGALSEGAPGPGIALHGPPARGQRAEDRPRCVPWLPVRP